MSKAIQPTQYLTTNTDYTRAINNAGKIEKAVVLAGSGKTVVDFPRYIKTYTSLVEKLIATDDRGAIDPNAYAAHQKLTEALQGLEKRVVATAVKAGVTPPSKELLQALNGNEEAPDEEPARSPLLDTLAHYGAIGAETVVDFIKPTSKWGWAKYAAAAGVVVLAPSQLWETAKKIPSAVKTAMHMIAGVPHVVGIVNGAIDNINRMLYGMGIGISWLLRRPLYLINLAPPPPQTKEELQALGGTLLTNAWTIPVTYAGSFGPILAPIVGLHKLAGGNVRDFGLPAAIGTAGAIVLETAAPGHPQAEIDLAWKHPTSSIAALAGYFGADLIQLGQTKLLPYVPDCVANSIPAVLTTIGTQVRNAYTNHPEKTRMLATLIGAIAPVLITAATYRATGYLAGYPAISS